MEETTVVNKINQTVSTSESDRAFLKLFEADVGMLAAMVIEAIDDNPAWLLSPVMRELLCDKAKLVRERFNRVQNRLVIDNPCEDLKL